MVSTVHVHCPHWTLHWTQYLSLCCLDWILLSYHRIQPQENDVSCVCPEIQHWSDVQHRRW